MELLPAQIIRKKRNGQSLTENEIVGWIQAYTAGQVPDYQMSAFLMAVYFRGMSTDETVFLVKAMMASGTTLTWPGHANFRVDKHSTGGVGDKTSLILAPIVAAAGLSVPMMSGRGLGHTGGTLDKLEAIPGFSTQLSLAEFDRLVRTNNMGMIGQTEAICPADKKMYALRDVTGTVESLPLVCASIMSKKLAEGIDGLVLDVKFGSGAFFKEQARARELAVALKSIGVKFGKKVVALLTTMEQPLGRYAGNALEVEECVDILQNKTCVNDAGIDLYADTRELSLELAAQMMFLSGRFGALESARAKAAEILANGEAWRAFELMISSQGGRLNELPRAKFQEVLKAETSGYVAAFDAELIGYANVSLGAGRAKVTDIIEPTAGFEVHVKTGQYIQAGSPLLTAHGPDRGALKAALEKLGSCIQITAGKAPITPLILESL